MSEKEMIEKLLLAESISYDTRQTLEIWSMRDRFPLSPKDGTRLLELYDQMFRYGVE